MTTIAPPLPPVAPVSTSPVACKCCGAPAEPIGAVDFNRVALAPGRTDAPFDPLGVPVGYHRCARCGFAFTPAFDAWTNADFASWIYNDDYVLADPDYRDVRPRANAAWVAETFAHARHLAILDYGGGTGQLARALGEAGFADVTTWDPFVAEHAARPARTFDLVLCYEVIEHAADPAAVVAELASLLAPEGVLLFSTLLQPADFATRGLDWWYAGPRNGHVSLHERRSLEWLFGKHGMTFGSFHDGFHAAFRAVPAWASALLGGGQAAAPAGDAPRARQYNALRATRYGMMLYNRNDAYVGRSIELYGEFSEGETELFAWCIRPGMLVLDVGANIGAHTLWLARAVGPTGAVIAFEPQRLVFQTLCANVALNSLTNVHCLQRALGPERGAITVPTLDPTRPQNFGGLSIEGHQTGEQVDLARLDDMGLPRCDFIKLDVEGMEQGVLEGARETIAKYRPLLYVENDRKDRSDALIRCIAALGYDLWWHRPPLFNPDNHDGNPENAFGRIVSVNMFCAPKEHAYEVDGLERVLVA